MNTKMYPARLLKEMAESCWGMEIKDMGEWNEKTEEFAPDDFYVVEVNEWYDDGRWKSKHDLVFLDKQDGKYYHIRYERGLTESQHYNPFDEYKKHEMVECDEVKITKTERTIIETTWEYI